VDVLVQCPASFVGEDSEGTDGKSALTFLGLRQRSA